MADFNWLLHAYCLMSNHDHLLVETPDGNLSAGMRQLNGLYTQRSNRKHGRVGHVFQGRYQAILVDQERDLLEVARSVVLNPVRADMVRLAQDWPWSSDDAMTGQVDVPRWLTTDALLSAFGADRGAAMQADAQFVADGVKAPPLADIVARHSNRDEAIAVAHATGHYSDTQIATHFGLHCTTVGRVVRRAKTGRER